MYDNCGENTIISRELISGNFTNKRGLWGKYLRRTAPQKFNTNQIKKQTEVNIRCQSSQNVFRCSNILIKNKSINYSNMANEASDPILITGCQAFD